MTRKERLLKKYLDDPTYENYITYRDWKDEIEESKKPKQDESYNKDIVVLNELVSSEENQNGI